MYRLDTTEMLVAEVVALRVALKRVIVEAAMRQGDPNGYLSDGFESAVSDVEGAVDASGDPARAAAIVDHAEEILREIYTVTLAIE